MGSLFDLDYRTGALRAQIGCRLQELDAIVAYLLSALSLSNG